MASLTESGPNPQTMFWDSDVKISETEIQTSVVNHFNSMIKSRLEDT